MWNIYDLLLVVCHCYRLENDIVRIISARQATKKEMMYDRRGNGMRDEYDCQTKRGERDHEVGHSPERVQAT
ncbi:MAG: hypothetical protein CVV46_02405 [Spirochaetae bacterium HGW-Spirochaetae-2]|nr:MAG: hypothetical protein CVV46_02405 [Spirochaetae bacterium HGW-Spirochaetae-2]